jgi:ribosomal-protein-alanine N-acetyltransferase
MPPPFLETERLFLRGFEPGDAPALARNCNDMNVVRWTSSHPFPYELKHAEEFIANREREYLENKAVVFGAFLKGSGDLVGGVGFHNLGTNERGELGYLVARAHWGHGYATEFAGRAVRHAFEDMKLVRVHAGVFSGNDASVRVLTKLGFKAEGVQRKHICRFGTWHDLILFGMLREEWKG